jgi:predicted DNA-binding protein
MSRNIGQFKAKPESLTKKAGRSYYDKEAIRQLLEDREDYLMGVAVLERQEPTISLGELERRLGLAR